MEQPFERGVSGNGSYLDHEAATSISGGSSQAVNVIFAIIYTLHITVSIVELLKEKEDDIGIWRTCTETESRSWINSYAVNALTISIISLALTSLNSLF